MKRAVLILSSFIFAALLFAIGISDKQPEQKIILKYAEVNPAGHIMDQCGYHFAELVRVKSNGRITVQVFPDSRLGNEKTMYQTLQKGGGTIDICRANTNSMGEFGCNKLGLLGLPFVFRDRAHLWTVLDSEIGDELLRDPQECGSGMVGLYYLDEGCRNFFTRKEIEVRTLKDFKGLKLRVPETALMADTVAALGAKPAPILFSELYSSLKNGVVDGAEQPFSGYYSNKLYEVAPNYTLTGHVFSPSIVLISEKVWNKLSSEDRKILLFAGKETEDWNRITIEMLDNELIKDIKNAGANIIEVKDKSEFVNAAKSVDKKYAAGYEKLYEAILAK